MKSSGVYGVRRMHLKWDWWQVVSGKASWKTGAVKSWQAFERQIREGNGFQEGKTRLPEGPEDCGRVGVLVTMVGAAWAREGAWCQQRGVSSTGERGLVIGATAAEKAVAAGKVWMILDTRRYCCWRDSGALKVVKCDHSTTCEPLCSCWSSFPHFTFCPQSKTMWSIKKSCLIFTFPCHTHCK